MPSIRNLSRKIAVLHAHEDGTDELLASFDARLQAERVRLVALSAALARAEDFPEDIFRELRDRAHKIRGGAAIFGIADIAEAACALELAAIAASESHAAHTDSAVWAALVGLVRLMGTIDAGEESAAAAPADSREAPTSAA